MKYTPFSEINDFEDITINDIPALFTNGRIDRDTLPIGLYAYDIRSGEDEPHATIEPFVGVNHQATIITMVEIDMTHGDYTPVEDIDFLGEFEDIESWKNKVMLELAESGEWRDRAIEILENRTEAHIGDIIGFVNEYWQNMGSDEENLEEFIEYMKEIINDIIDD
ncbi:MAG: hypothetical protein LBT43_19145 [Prevotella sp.]|jgi:hypothetical protein|nr:hypothetical protein [Prevotella sp.]